LVTFSLQWMETQAVINHLGDLLEALGGYFVLRFLIRDREDIRRTIRVFAFIAVVVAIFMVREKLTLQNVFWLAGGKIRPNGIPMSISDVRDGSVRAQGPFQVYLSAGEYGATLLPLLVWLWWDGKSRVAAILGTVGATVMVVA